MRYLTNGFNSEQKSLKTNEELPLQSFIALTYTLWHQVRFYQYSRSHRGYTKLWLPKSRAD